MFFVHFLSGEALGAIGCNSVVDLLAKYAKDPVPEVVNMFLLCPVAYNSSCCDYLTENIDLWLLDIWYKVYL